MNMDDDKVDKSIYRYIIKHTKKDQIFLLVLTMISMPLVYGVLEIPKLIINGALANTNIPDEILGYPIDQVKYLLVLCGVFLALILINGGMTYIYNVYRGVLGEKMLGRFRADLYSRLLRFPIPRFKQVSQGEIIPMITAETEPLGAFIGDSIAVPVFQGGLLITYLFFIFNQDVWLGLAALALYPPQLYIIPKIQKHVNVLGKRRVQTVRELSDKIGESVSGISDIHSNDMSRFEKGKIKGKLKEIYDIRLSIFKKWFLIKFLNSFLGQLTPFFFYAIGGYFVIKGDLSLGALVAVLAAYKDLDTSWKELLSFYQVMENVKVRYGQIVLFFQPDNMLDLKLQAEPESTDNVSDSSVQTTTLSYSEDAFINPLDGVSFKIESGRHVALLGQSGSGRSVLTQLVARLINPSNGTIKIAGQDIAALCEADIGKKISYVDQQSFVFNGTVKDNLLYGLRSQPLDEQNPELDQRIQEALKALQFEQRILEFGLNSCIDSAAQPELSEMVLNARREMRKILSQDDYHDLVDVLSAQNYNTNLSAAENLIFGVPKQVATIEELLEDVRVTEVMQQTGLKQKLFSIGIETSRVMIDMFSGVAEDSPMYARFNFIRYSELPAFQELSKLPEDTDIQSMDADDVNRLINLSFKLTVARHRLGMITPDVQALIIQTHLLLRETLGEDNQVVEFYDDERVAEHLTIQDNILFGRIAYGQANAQQKVADLTKQVIISSGQTAKVTEIGLGYEVGVAGAKLTSIQRQKLTMARALIKNPEILIVNEASSLFEKEVEEVLVENILGIMRGKTVIWVLNNIDCVDNFDELMMLEQGKLLAQGSPDEVKKLIDQESNNNRI